MEFAFLNAAAGSPGFPPLDPWLSGFAISYYYFGYVMTAPLARLAVVPTAIAFNLGVAWLAAGASVGAFGLVYNLIMARRAPDHAAGTRGQRRARARGAAAPSAPAGADRWVSSPPSPCPSPAT